MNDEVIRYRIPKNPRLWKWGTPAEGIIATPTARGLDVHGWYDHFVGIEGGVIPWDELERELRTRRRRRRKDE